MIVLTLLSAMVSIGMTRGAYRVSAVDLAVALIGASVSCGALVWLRRQPTTHY